MGNYIRFDWAMKRLLSASQQGKFWRAGRLAYDLAGRTHRYP